MRELAILPSCPASQKSDPAGVTVSLLMWRWEKPILTIPLFAISPPPPITFLFCFGGFPGGNLRWGDSLLH